jgi:hypothetical protein
VNADGIFKLEPGAVIAAAGDFTLVGEVRTGSNMPTQYRLARKPDGELVLQGGFSWWCGNESGVEWRDLPTVELP